MSHITHHRLLIFFSYSTGSGLINNPKLAQDIIAACKEAGGPDFAVSVKTRIGFDSYEDVFEEWVGNLLEAEPDGMSN